MPKSQLGGILYIFPPGGDGISSICLTIDNLKNLINFASLCVLTLDVHNAVILFRLG